MTIVRTVLEYRTWRAALDSGQRIGFTPTMGALHDGHLSHLEVLRPIVDKRVVSIFVNPTQFGPNEDFDRYPRDLDGDAEKLKQAGCDVLFFPSVEEMYPEGNSTSIHVTGISERYEGSMRPGHFDGVATIVAKLLAAIEPDVMTLGQKDAQQVAVIRQMMQDLLFRASLCIVPTLREADGLAMSSRNAYLSAGDRETGLSISRGLFLARELFRESGSIEAATTRLRAELSPELAVDYADLVDERTFQPATELTPSVLGIVAARIGTTRLIDNLRFMD